MQPRGLTASPEVSNSFQGGKISFGDLEGEVSMDILKGISPRPHPTVPKGSAQPYYPPSCPDPIHFPREARSLGEGLQHLPPSPTSP